MSDLTAAPILVTGGAGFLGSHLVEALVARGGRVTVVDDLSSGRTGNLATVARRIRFLRMDLARAELGPLLERGGFGVVFHLAANAYVPSSVADPQDDLTRNATATLKLIEAMRRVSPGSRLLYTSSAAVYGEGGPAPIDESAPLVPLSPYGVSKLAAERYATLYARMFGLRAASARLFSVYGPRLRKQVVYDLMARIAQRTGELFIHGDGTQERDYTYAADAVEALLLLAERAPFAGEAWNVASGEVVSVDALARRLCAAMGESPRFRYSGSLRVGDIQRWEADVSRLRGLGFVPRVGLEEGLRRTVEWFRSEPPGRRPAEGCGGTLSA